MLLKRKFIVITLLLNLNLVASATNLKKEKNMSSNQEKIISIVSQMSKAMQQGKLDEVMSAYESTATLVASPDTFVSGLAFKEAMNGYVSMKPVFTMPKHEVIESGDIALHIAPWTMKAIDPSTGNEITQNGLSLAVFRKQKDGGWLMVIDNPFGDNLLQNK